MKTAKDWVESLHRKIDLLSTVMNIIETRHDAIESGICVVPLSLQAQAAEISYSHTVQSSATQPVNPTPTTKCDHNIINPAPFEVQNLTGMN